jgi:hypothetical protein
MTAPSNWTDGEDVWEVHVNKADQAFATRVGRDEMHWIPEGVARRIVALEVETEKLRDAMEDVEFRVRKAKDSCDLSETMVRMQGAGEGSVAWAVESARYRAMCDILEILEGK